MKQCGHTIGMMGHVFLIAALVAVTSARVLAQSSSSEPPKQSSVAQTAPSQLQCDVVKQMLFLVDVSGSMETNDRLNEAKQFALRIMKEHAAKNLLYKLISYGGSCNEIITDVDWTRDATIINAGVKGLYLRGGTPLGSALEFTIDEIKKSAYPDQTKVILLNDGANACGDVSEILTRRIKEIPCVRFVSIGIELEEEENGFSSRAINDAQAIAAQTGGSYVPLKDVREIRGVSVGDTSVAVRPVEFEPRKKPQVQAKAEEKPAEQAPQAQTQPQTQAQSQEKPQEKSQEKAPEKSQEKAPAQTESASPTTSQAPSSSRAESSTSTEQKQNEQKQNGQSASAQRDTSQTSQAQRSQPQSASPQESSSATAEKRAARNEQTSSPPPSKEQTLPVAKAEPRNVTANDAEGARNSDNSQRSGASQGNAIGFAVTAPNTNEETVVLRFASGSSEVTPPMRTVLSRLAARLRSQRFAYPTLQVEVEGHSSDEGTSEANLRLSVERAAAVARYLRQQTGMREENVRWTGYGELRPAADDRFGRHTSRRVEVRVSESHQR